MKKGGGKQMWVPKSDEKEAAGEGKMEETEEREPPNEVPAFSTRSDGHYYDRIQMLQFFQTLKNKDPVKEKPAVKTTLTERPQEEAADDVGTRRQMRNQVKAQKELTKRRSNEALDDDEAPMTDMASLMHSMSSYGDVNPAMMQYLQSMYNSPVSPMMYRGSGGQTTVMLRNIPNRYTREMLSERLKQGYEGKYDFVYLPIDFNSKCNVGYAFINFRMPESAAKFIQEFHGAKTSQCLPGFSSAKVCEVSYARVQGRDANMENLRDEKFIDKLNERPEWQPLFLDEDNKEIPFSMTLGMISGKRRTRASVTPTASSVPMSPYGSMVNMYSGYMTPTPSAAAQSPPTSLSGVLPAATTATMLMLKGVPTSFSRAQVVATFDKKFKAMYDFLFLAGDAKTEVNKGYLFINFRKFDKAQAFIQEYHQRKVVDTFGGDGPNTDTCEIQPARLESIEKSIERLQANGKGSEKTQWCPVLFNPSGDEIAFPTLAPKSGGKGGKDQHGGATPSAPSGKGNAKGKTKNGAAASAAAAAAYGYGYGGYNPYAGYPYGGYGAYNAAYQAQAAVYAAAMQRASAHHAYAAAAAAANATPKAKAKAAKELTETQKVSLREQIEFYFSPDNLVKDVYLRTHMDTSGWTPMDLIAQFNQVKKFRQSIAVLSEVLEKSALLEVDKKTRCLRLKDPATRDRWANMGKEAETTVHRAS